MNGCTQGLLNILFSYRWLHAGPECYLAYIMITTKNNTKTAQSSLQVGLSWYTSGVWCSKANLGNFEVKKCQLHIKLTESQYSNQRLPLSLAIVHGTTKFPNFGNFVQLNLYIVPFLVI